MQITQDCTIALPGPSFYSCNPGEPEATSRLALVNSESQVPGYLELDKGKNCVSGHIISIVVHTSEGRRRRGVISQELTTHLMEEEHLS